MAKSYAHEGKTLEELEKEITCGVCQEHYTEPKVLPCLHYYCKKCILKLACGRGPGKPFSCPECREEATLPEGGVDQLKAAFFVNRLKSMFSALERAHGKVEVKCETCTDSGGKAEAFCRQCAAFVCNECIKLHKKIKTLSSHEINSFDQLKQGKIKQIVLKEVLTKKCQVHAEPLIIYCADCDDLICQHCTVKDHKDHNFEFSRVAAPGIKKTLLQQLKPLKNVILSLSQAAKQIDSTKHDLKAQGDDVAIAIQTTFKELREIVVKREQELLEEAKGIVRAKVNKLSMQEKILSLASVEVQSIVDYTERCVRHCTDNEVMITHAEMSSKIEKKTDYYSQSLRSLEPVEEADVGVEVKCAEALQHLCQSKAHLVQVPVDLTKSMLGMKSPETAAVAETSTSKFTFIPVLADKLAKKKYKLNSCLKSLCTGTVTECSINETGDGDISIHYTPAVRGYHKLTVWVDRQQATNTSFPVFVSIHPTQLRKPVKIWDGLSSPCGITVNSEGEIIVCELTGDIIKFDRNGKRRTLVKSSQHELTNLRSVAVDHEDNIYCIDSKTNTILKCDKTGGNVRINVTKQVKGPGYYGVTVVRNEVMVCERNRGGISVYDKDLKYARSIEHKDIGQLLDIAADSHGNLFVSDTTNKCVHVFSKDGALLRSFGCDGNGKNKLGVPWGVYVSSQYVYVTDNSDGSVKVFTVEGKHVTSFGQYGSKPGDFRGPYYICVDENGFVYVTDNSNNRIQCF